MPAVRTVLIVGSNDALANALADQLRATNDRPTRLRSPSRAALVETGSADDVWYLSGWQSDEVAAKRVIASLPRLGQAAFHLVGTISDDLRAACQQQCAANNIRCLLFDVPHLLTEDMWNCGGGESALGRFLQVFDSTVSEIEGKLPDYFRQRPLHWLVPDGAGVDLAGVDDVTESLVAVSRRGMQGSYRITSDRHTQLAEFCRYMGAAWNIDITMVTDERELNVVCRHLQRRLADIALVDDGGSNRFRDTTCFVPTIDGTTQQILLRGCRDRLSTQREAASAEKVAFRGRLARRAVVEIPGLTYETAGHGDPPLIVVNAIGQGTEVWLPLLQHLSGKRRIVVWEMRQTDHLGRPVSFMQHCDDLHAVVSNACADICDLVGWCTGAKLAACYARMHPGIARSLVFLGGSFKHSSRDGQFDTPYERNLEIVLRAVVNQPELTDRLRVLLAPAAPGPADICCANEELAARTLTGLSVEVEHQIRRPFCDVASLRIYAQQHLEFWSHDETATGSQLCIPVLAVSGACDQVVSPSGLQAALKHFPSSRYHEIEGATHYCFHDSPDLVAHLIEEFVDDVASR